MSRKNTFLPLIQYRNQRKIQALRNSVQIVPQDPSLKSIKNYESIFDDDSFKFSKLMEKKDEQAANLIRKYLSKFQTKKLKRKRHEKDSEKDHNTAIPIQISKSFDIRIRSKPKLIKISPLSKSIAVSPSKQPVLQQSKPKRQKSRQLTQQQPQKKVNIVKFPIKILDDGIFKSKQQLFSRYGVLKTEISRSLQKGLRIQNYDLGVPKNSYLQKIKRKPDSESKLDVYQLSSRYQSELDQQGKNSYIRNIRGMKSLELGRKFKIMKTQKNSLEKNSRDSHKFAKKILKQKLDDIQPWIDDKPEREFRDTMR